MVYWKFPGIRRERQGIPIRSIRYYTAFSPKAQGGEFLSSGQPGKLEFARRAGGQVVTYLICGRSFPDPLGIVLWFDKLEFGPQGGRPSRDEPGLWSLLP